MNNDLDAKEDKKPMVGDDDLMRAYQPCGLCSEKDFRAGLWKLFPLVLPGQEIPEFRGSAVQEILKAFWLENGTLVFWAKLKWKKGITALISFRNNTFRTVMTDKGEIFVPVSDPIPGHLTLPGAFTEDRCATIIPTPQRIYINAKIKTGWFSGYRSIFSWDGERLSKVLGRGDKIKVGNDDFWIDSAQTVCHGETGSLLIEFESTNPSRKSGLCLLNESDLILLACEGDKLPTKIDAGFCWRFPEWCQFRRGVLHNSLICCIQYGQQVGLFRLSGGKIEHIVAGDKLLRCGNLNPVNTSLHLLRALSSQLILLHAEVDDSEYLLVYDHGAIRCISHQRFVHVFFGDAILLPGAANHFLFLHGNIHHWDGGRLSIISEDLLFDQTAKMRAVPHGQAGVIVEGNRLMPGKDGALHTSMEESQYFLDSRSPSSGLAPVPEFPMVGMKTVRLSDVLAWKSCEEAVVQIDRGIYLLQKQI